MFDLSSFSKTGREGVKQPLTGQETGESEFRRSQEPGAGGIRGQNYPRLSSIAPGNIAQRANRTQAGSLAGVWTFTGGHVGEFAPRRSYGQFVARSGLKSVAQGLPW